MWTSSDNVLIEELPPPVYRTDWGRAYCGDSLELLAALPAESVDLVMTSPPFALQRTKSYGNTDQSEYVDWLLQFARPVRRVLKPSGSFVIDLGGAYQKGVPVRSLYNYRVLIRFCDDAGFHLAEEFFWHNPAKLPSPIEWVNKRKIRAKDSVNTVWWLSKTEAPKANVRNVLVPYSERMKKLLADSENFYSPKKRPSGHDISTGFACDNGGAIPSNLLEFPNTESNSLYLRACKAVGADAHPARFPEKLPAFFVRFLTDPDDTVLDIFAGSNTTGMAAQNLGRKWLSFEIDDAFVRSSALRFVDIDTIAAMTDLWERLSNEHPVILRSAQMCLFR
ncbi:MAG: site-specific DNA-methyltransferase [Planctomycetes bacterium]|nr:site-specific DNA-methyltransferase [Planctomycetota bacterium]